MSRYSATSDSLQIRPVARNHECPALIVELRRGDVEDPVERVQDALHASASLRGRAAGYATVDRMSPAATTSDLRNQTMTSPSVCAAGAYRISTTSPPKYTCFMPVKNVSCGHTLLGLRCGLAPQAAHPVEHVLVGSHGGAFDALRFTSGRTADAGLDVSSGLRERLIAAVWCSSALVLMMCRMGLSEMRRIAASTLSLIAATLESTSSSPSGSTCTVMLAPDPATRCTFPCTGSTSTLPSSYAGFSGRNRCCAVGRPPAAGHRPTASASQCQMREVFRHCDYLAVELVTAAPDSFRQPLESLHVLRIHRVSTALRGLERQVVSLVRTPCASSPADTPAPVLSAARAAPRQSRTAAAPEWSSLDPA